MPQRHNHALSIFPLYNPQEAISTVNDYFRTNYGRSLPSWQVEASTYSHIHSPDMAIRLQNQAEGSTFG